MPLDRYKGRSWHVHVSPVTCPRSKPSRSSSPPSGQSLPPPAHTKHNTINAN